MKVKFLDLRGQYEALKDEINPAVARVMESGGYILGENVKMLEEEVAAFCGARYCVGVASGTDAILLALRACGVSAGDGVVTTPFTFTASVEAIMRAGARPVLCDIEPDTFNIDPDRLEKAAEGAAAVLPVHLYGHPADMDAVLRVARGRGLKVVEDAAQSFGAEWRGVKAGALGDAGCFSFFPSKTLGAFGDAGMAATGDEGVYKKLMLLRAHGIEGMECVESGYNSRLDEMQAAVLRVKLKHIGEWLKARKKAADTYSSLLKGLPVGIPAVKENAVHSFNYYVIKCPGRDDLRKHLFSRGIETGVYYPVPVHLQKAFAGLGYARGDFPAAERLAGEVLALPIYPEITETEQRSVADAIGGFYSG